MKTIKILLTIAIFFFSAVPDARAEAVKSAEADKPAEVVKPAEADKPAEVRVHVATVKDAQTAGSYVYLLVDEDGKELWLATMPSLLKTSVSPGDKVEYSNEISMANFQSKALGKTFDTILFITKIRVLEKEMPKDDFHKIIPKDETPVSAPAAGEIEKAADGKTIAELFSEYETLKDKEVTIRARVMKVKKNILKRTWLTLQDGTGSASDDKLHATTTEAAQQGDIIVVRGILRTNVDLGGQYKYKILLEETKIVGK